MVRIDIMPKAQQTRLSAGQLLCYLLGRNEKLEAAILSNISIFAAYDYDLYEAVGSIKPCDNVPLNKVTKLLEVVDIVSFRDNTGKDKIILKEERVEELRKKALSQEE